MPETLNASVAAQIAAASTARELLLALPHYSLYLTSGATRTFNGQVWTHRPFELTSRVSRSGDGSTARAPLRLLNVDGWWAGYLNRPDFSGTPAVLYAIFPATLVAGDATTSAKYHVLSRGRVSNVRRELDVMLDIVGQDDGRPAIHRACAPTCGYNYGDDDCTLTRTEADVTVAESGTNWLRFDEALSTTFDFWREAAVRGLTVDDTARNINVDDARLCQRYVGVQVSGTDLSAAASDDSYNSGAAAFVVANYQAGDKVYVSGFATAGNNGVKTVVSCTTAKLIVEEALTNESAGPSVTVDGRVVLLDYGFEVQPGADDTFRLIESCDQTLPDCDERKGNKVNFGGFEKATQEIYPLTPKVKQISQ